MCVCVCVFPFFFSSYEFKFLLHIFLQENFVAAFNFCPCGTNHLQKIVPYNSKFWAAEDGPLSELDFPQNLQLKNSFPIHELTEVKGKGRYLTFHQNNRHRFTGKDLTVMGLQEKIFSAFQDKAIELLGKKKLNEFDSLVKSSQATQNHPTIRQQVQLLATNITPAKKQLAGFTYLCLCQCNSALLHLNRFQIRLWHVLEGTDLPQR